MSSRKMDDLPGMLQDTYGLRPQGKHAPMAAIKKSTPQSVRTSRSVGQAHKPSNHSGNSESTDVFGLSSGPLGSSGRNSSADDLFSGFGAPGASPQSYSSDPFGGSSAFSARVDGGADDMFGSSNPNISPTSLHGSPLQRPSQSFPTDDVFGLGTSNAASQTAQSASVTSASSFDDLLGNDFAAPSKLNGKSSRKTETFPAGDDLLGLGKLGPTGSLSTRQKPRHGQADPFASVAPEPLFADNHSLHSVSKQGRHKSSAADQAADIYSDPFKESMAAQSRTAKNKVRENVHDVPQPAVPPLKSNSVNDGESREGKSKSGRWLSVEEIILMTPPSSRPPPSRLPPSLPSLSEAASVQRDSRMRGKDRVSESRSGKWMADENRPAETKRHDSAENSSAGGLRLDIDLDDLESFVSGGDKPAGAGVKEETKVQSIPLEKAARAEDGEGLAKLSKAKKPSDGRQATAKAQAQPVPNAFGTLRESPPRQRSPPRRRDSDINESAAAAASSAAAMKEVLERAQRKAEAAREAREREREKEKAAVEAANQAAAAKARAQTRPQSQSRGEQTFPRSSSGASTNGATNDFFNPPTPRQSSTEGRHRPPAKAGGPVDLNDLAPKRSASQTKAAAPEAHSNTKQRQAGADDWMNVLGGTSFQAGPSGDEFQDVAGETEERRRLRFERFQRVKERGAAAVEELNRRDLDSQREQAERERAGDMLNLEIKRWAAGKEGNLRALLSTLQYVLWPECNWTPISLGDLMSGAMVKKAYRKATLCVHPDKVQGKGATVQQKYIAEKVFDLLKEAWNKFNSEELF